MFIVGLLREVTERRFPTGNGMEGLEHVLTVETEQPIELVQISMRREHQPLVESYRSLVGRRLLIPVQTFLLSPKSGGKQFAPFLKWNTSGDGKAAPFPVSAAKAA